ncbi:MAG: hypothetical protein JST22_20495 [Bacteroidetes bacterium]|nr:hypothetical protein [Bacteroidota bacterium]
MTRTSHSRLAVAAALLLAAAAFMAAPRAHAQITCNGCRWVTVVVDPDVCTADFCMRTADCEICYQVDPGNSYRIECIDGATFKMLVCIRNGVPTYATIPVNGCTINYSVPSGCCMRACLTLVNGCYELHFSHGPGPCAACIQDQQEVN